MSKFGWQHAKIKSIYFLGNFKDGDGAFQILYNTEETFSNYHATRENVNFFSQS